MITATVICDSLNESTGDRLTTMLVRFHRFILPEVLTHRVFSRNTSSSRAISVSKKLDAIREDIAIPISFGKAASTMWATEEHTDGIFINSINDYVSPETAWKLSAEAAMAFAEAFKDSKYHKQVVNRIIEPYTWTDMVITSTEWDNFFKLRISPDAQPEIRELAIKMKEALDNSKPISLTYDKWHLPFVTEEEKLDYTLYEQKQLSVVRCARVSYKTNKDDNYNPVKDLELFTRLRDSGHLSPFEHIATLCTLDNEYLQANFNGFVQYRAYIEEELYYKENIEG